MKRLTAILVTVLMVFSLQVTAFAAPSEVTWEDYQQYLIDTAGSNAPDLQEFTDQVEALSGWEDIDQTAPPWDMIFTNVGLSTWDEFQSGDVKEALVPKGEVMAGGPPEESSEGEASENETQGPQKAPLKELPANEIPGMKVSSFATNNGDTSRPQDEGHIYVGYAVTDGKLDADNSNWEGDTEQIVLDEDVEGEGFTAVRVEGDSEVSISGSLHIYDGSDGQIVSDFTGTGAGITGSNGALVTVDGFNFRSEGFARSFAVIQDGTLIVNNSDVVTMGKDPLLYAWDGYYNSANTSMMISPPWVLGIQGGVRSVNILGKGSSFVAADSSISAGGWGVVSTDGCQNPYLWLFNSKLNILPGSEGGMNSGWKILGYDENAYGSGYGTYLIGGAQEYFYGTSINGTTYASILTGGDGFYAGLNAGETIDAFDEEGKVIAQYEAEEDIHTEINSVFGFMAHNSGSINLLPGTIVNSEEATFLYKSADSTWNVESAQLHPKSGIIFQMIDNDDATVGGFDPFGTYLVEEEGFPLDAYDGAVSYVFTTDTEVDPSKTYYTSDTDDASGYAVVEDPTDEGTVAYYEKSTGGNRVELNLSSSEYVGDIFNATGYYNQASDALTVNIDPSATLSGDIALTSHVHGIFLYDRDVDDVIAAIKEANAYHKEIGGYYADTDPVEYVFLDAEGFVTSDKKEAVAIQFTKFSTIEYYLLGHVLNMVNYNGLASIDVNVEGTWNVAAASLVTYLNIAEDAHVYGELVELSDGSLFIIPSGEEIEPGEYGNEFIYVEGEGSKGGPGGGESADGESGGESAEGMAVDGASGNAPQGSPAGGEAQDDELLEAYKAYMHEWLLKEFEVNDNMQESQLAEFQACIDANDYSKFPGDMFFNGMLESGKAMTFEEFAASQK